MKKAIGIILLWVIGAMLGGVPVWLVITVAGGIFASCYLGVYHRYVGAGAGLTFIWGLGVLAFGLPTLSSVYEKAPTAMAKTSKVVIADVQDNKETLKSQVASAFSENKADRNELMNKLAALDEARAKGVLSEAEFAEMRSKILEEFSTAN